ncbi:UDP-N-acetylmuramoyl-tripeptide--D-alanyl-D-alanine ligase [Ferrimonas lipolytica]|uniref:UDP-N-acetylmuramoyl-tripeptide--D-alanyl-D-alanine ligase n=1 Tax=Ferrimonas lipolytica TaxID=2724191 RepID=A0A6H1UIS2_9GAMM|nr:UDP-N-acetylmuramoyl-tripeptide--D-alanyl-D-alanine ligase [Ferrimonas lipolytica]QIZ78529.1 UDP-N-acetylmuramoyl-tripeptide--D-alanyl-D-alanine ligase [Ferrimonas lipolytica]
MISASLDTIASALGAEIHGRQDVTITRVSTNSRELASGDLFVALVGERFDAHDFIEQAEQAGAAAVMVSRQLDTSLPQLLVQDTTLGLGQLAAWLKRQVTPYSVALTGSVGKTSVKEMTAAIFSLAGTTLATKGNLNNTIGVPLTLLDLSGDEQYAVLELGANAPGEIRYTSSLVQADAALINNVQPAHLEGFGGIDGVAEAKSEIFEALQPQGIAVVNLDDDYAEFMLAKLEQQPVLRFSSRQIADIWAEQLTRLSNGCYQFQLCCGEHRALVTLPLPGRHQVDNALAAASLAHCAELSLALIAKGLSQAPSVPGRTQYYRLTPQLTVIDDSYNANLASTKAGIDLLAEISGTSVLLFADMGELGDSAAAHHRAVGQYALDKGIDHLISVGTVSALTAEAFGSGVHFADQPAMVDHLFTWLGQLPPPVTILVKGSRSARMENVVDALRQQFEVTP